MSKEENKKQLIEGLNKLLATQMVFYQNTRNFHWNVKGQNFFTLHEKFEELYDFASLQADQIAERILALGGTPPSTLAQFIEQSWIPEASAELSPQEMVQTTTQNLKTLNSHIDEIADIADELADRPTTTLLDDLSEAQAEYEWMFNSFLQ
jgi:starvation-inducible DNA-binding protein